MTESSRQIAELESFAGPGTYGLEWGDPETDPELRAVVSDWIAPQVPGSVALEIGSGGGRWSRYFQAASLAYLVDATPKSEELIRGLCDCSRFRFLLSPDGSLPAIPSASVDYAFSFDTFVHFGRELFDAYLAEVARVLKPGGVFHLHHAAEIGGERNAECFQYRGPLELAGTMRGLGFELPARRMFRRCGYGSILVECYRA